MFLLLICNYRINIVSIYAMIVTLTFPFINWKQEICNENIQNTSDSHLFSDTQPDKSWKFYLIWSKCWVRHYAKIIHRHFDMAGNLYIAFKTIEKPMSWAKFKENAKELSFFFKVKSTYLMHQKDCVIKHNS